MNTREWDMVQPERRRAESVLEEAQQITGEGGARSNGYDHPRPNFTKIAAKWSVTLGVPVTAEQVALMMIDLKTVREGHTHRRDNLVDIAGYARCLERLEERPEEGGKDPRQLSLPLDMRDPSLR